MNYNIINGISVGISTGIETFTQPRFSYAPLFFRAALNGGTRINSFHTEINMGGHLTGHRKQGFLFRYLLGYRLRVFHTLFADVCLAYTFQNLYKTFPGAHPEDDGYHNFESIGLSVGFDIN